MQRIVSLSRFFIADHIEKNLFKIRTIFILNENVKPQNALLECTVHILYSFEAFLLPVLEWSCNDLQQHI
jgi:hypothetical protein